MISQEHVFSYSDYIYLIYILLFITRGVNFNVYVEKKSITKGV